MPLFDTAHVIAANRPFTEPVRIYTGILGQIGDIIMFTAVVRRIREIFPNSSITFAVSKKYASAGELIAGLSYIDRVFITESYFEHQNDTTYAPWHLGWPADIRGNDEVVEQRKHDIILETRPRHRRMPWWEYGHFIDALAYMVGVPGPLDLRAEIRIPDDICAPDCTVGRIVFHNDSTIDETNSWPWEQAQKFLRIIGAENVVLIGSPGPEVPGAIDLRGKTSLVEAAAIIRSARCYVGINSGPMIIAGSLDVPVVGVYGTRYLPSEAWWGLQPVNPHAVYLGVEGGLEDMDAERVAAAIPEAEGLYASTKLQKPTPRAPASVP